MFSHFPCSLFQCGIRRLETFGIDSNSQGMDPLKVPPPTSPFWRSRFNVSAVQAWPSSPSTASHANSRPTTEPMSYFPPPPRRVAAPSTPPPAPKTLWGRASATAGNAWGGLYRVADSVGGWTNAQTAKVCRRLQGGKSGVAAGRLAQIGTESFYPTSLDVECNKGRASSRCGRSSS